MSRNYRRGLRDAHRLLGRMRMKLEGDLRDMKPGLLGRKTAEMRRNLAQQQVLYRAMQGLENDLRKEIKEELEALNKEAETPLG